MSDKNFLVEDTVWFYIRKHDFMSKGIIKEIFILDEIPFALIRNGHMETKMPISQIFHDDLELIAVITAAIAASEGTSTDGLVVRSIRKVNNRRK